MEVTIIEQAFKVTPLLPDHLKTSPQATPLVVHRVSPRPVAMVCPAGRANIREKPSGCHWLC